MKKPLVALAVASLTSFASAQSSVTILGVIDAAINGVSNKTEGTLGNRITTSRTSLVSSGYNSSRLGFRGTEDLGGGLAASFWLEAAIGSDDGTTGGNTANYGPTVTGLFNRRSTVSLSGVFGEVRLGRDYVPTFWNDSVFDPLGANGVGANLIFSASGFTTQGAVTNGFGANSNQIRASNSIGYFLPPDLGGFYGQVMYAMNEKTSYDPGTLTPPGASAFVTSPNNSPDPAGLTRAGRYVGARGGFANGPLDVALAYGQSTIAANYFAGTTQRLDIWNVGASYDFGPVKIFGEYSNNKLKRDSSSGFVSGVFNPSSFREPGANGWLIGATVPVGPGLIRVAYSAIDYKNSTRINQLKGRFSEPKSEKLALGYVHNLSKRTALYATVARLNNKEGLDLNLIGGPSYATPTAQTGPLTPKSSTGYDLGIRHAF